MKNILFLFMLIIGLISFTTTTLAQPALTPFVQENILRVAPDDSAAFVSMVKPPGGTPMVEILSRQGDWEEARLHYRFKYNGSTDPNICMMSLFERTFTGFRKITEIKPE